MALFLLSILFSLSKSTTFDVTDLYSLSILNNVWTELVISANPSKGLIWGVFSESQSKIAVKKRYGRFVQRVENGIETAGQSFNISCSDCKTGELTSFFLFLKKPWGTKSTYVRKIEVSVL